MFVDYKGVFDALNRTTPPCIACVFVDYKGVFDALNRTTPPCIACLLTTKVCLML